MNPSTLMPRKTDPVKEASMADTLPHRYDDSTPGRRAGQLPGGADARGDGERDRGVGRGQPAADPRGPAVPRRRDERHHARRVHEVDGRAEPDQSGGGRGQDRRVLGHQPCAEQPDQPQPVARERRGDGVDDLLRPGQQRHARSRRRGRRGAG